MHLQSTPLQADRGAAKLLPHHRTAPSSRRRQSRSAAAAESKQPLGSEGFSKPAKEEPFDEGAAQVQRLLQRDRRELQGFDDELSEKAEFDEEPIKDSRRGGGKEAKASSGGASPSSPFQQGPAKAASPFGNGAGPAQPAKQSFSSPRGRANPFGGEYSTSGLTALEEEGAAEEDPPWWRQITLAQVVIVLSFVTIIGLMIGTFTVVLNAGGIHFNE